MKMKNLFLILILICLSIPLKAQDQDIFGRSNKLRRGAEANIPALSAGEYYWASDVNKLYIGKGDGSKRAIVFEESEFAGATRKTESHLYSSGYEVLSVDDKTNLSITTGTTVLGFQGFVAGRVYTIKLKGDYSIAYPINTEGFPDAGTYPTSSITTEDVYQFIMFDPGSGGKIYFGYYGQGY